MWRIKKVTGTRYVRTEHVQLCLRLGLLFLSQLHYYMLHIPPLLSRKRCHPFYSAVVIEKFVSFIWQVSRTNVKIIPIKKRKIPVKIPIRFLVIERSDAIHIRNPGFETAACCCRTVGLPAVCCVLMFM